MKGVGPQNMLSAPAKKTPVYSAAIRQVANIDTSLMFCPDVTFGRKTEYELQVQVLTTKLACFQVQL